MRRLKRTRPRASMRSVRSNGMVEVKPSTRYLRALSPEPAAQRQGFDLLDVATCCLPPQACTRQFRRDLDSLQDGSLDLHGWDTPYDRMALIILADQLSRCSVDSSSMSR